MSRSGLYTLVALLSVLVIGLAAYLVYQQQQKPQLSVSVGKSGIEVSGHG